MHIELDHSLLFNSSPYPYLVMSNDLTIIDANAAYLRAVHRTKEDIVGRYVFEAFPENPNDPDSTNISEVKSSLEMAIATGRPNNTPFLRYSVPVTTESGVVFEERFWSTVHTPAMAPDGTVAYVFQNAIDVTDIYRFDRDSDHARLNLELPAKARTDNFNRAQMHEAMARVLKDERGHFRNLFNQAPGFVAVLTGPRFVFEMANEAYYQLVGHRDIIGKPVWEALPEVRGQGYEELLNQVYSTGEPWRAYDMPLSVQREAGGPVEQRFIDLSYQAYRGEDGTTMGIFAQGYDVTEAHNARQAERKSSERLQEGMVAAKMVVWDWNIPADSLYVSDNATQVIGVTSASVEELERCLVVEDRELVNAARDKALAECGSYHVALRFIRPDTGVEVWLDVRGRVVCDEQGIPSSVRGVAIDITDRMKAEAELRETDKRKDEFLAMLAHELRNPLAPISTAAQVLRLTAQSPERVKATSEIITRQVHHMTNLIDDLLDVSRVTRGLIELEKEPVEIKSIVSSALEQARPLLEERHHELTTHFGSSAMIVKGDRTRLVQVLSNLLNNAAKYTAQGGKIDLAVVRENANAVITLRDNGIGIEPELLPRLFDLFSQGYRTSDRAQGGLGLGLALVKSILVMHRGRVDAASEGPGKGSTFTVTLPLAENLAAALPDVAPVSAHALQALRILVVDDNHDAAQSLGALLEATGHEVWIAAEAEEALRIAAKNPLDAFILDIGLPGMNGYELARHLRNEKLAANALLIALTGYSQAHDRVLSMAAGFDHHFVKPVNWTELSKLLVRR